MYRPPQDDRELAEQLHDLLLQHPEVVRLAATDLGRAYSTMVGLLEKHGWDLDAVAREVVISIDEYVEEEYVLLMSPDDHTGCYILARLLVSEMLRGLWWRVQTRLSDLHSG